MNMKVRSRPVRSKELVRKENAMSEYFEALSQKPLKAQIFSLLRKTKSSGFEFVSDQVVRHKVSSLLVYRDHLEFGDDSGKILNMKKKDDRFGKWFDEVFPEVKKTSTERVAKEIIAKLSPDFAAYLAENGVDGLPVQQDAASSDSGKESGGGSDDDGEEEIDTTAEALLRVRTLQKELSTDAGKGEQPAGDDDDDDDDDADKDDAKKKSKSSEKVSDDDDDDDDDDGNGKTSKSSVEEEDWDTEDASK